MDLRAFGVDDVRILEGGLPKWISQGRALEEGAPEMQPRHFTAASRSGCVASLADVRTALASDSAQVVDARPAARFRRRRAGAASRPAQRPYAGQREPAVRRNCRSRQAEARAALATIMAAHGVDLASPQITTCGSGVTAAILALAVEEAGGAVAGLYDGSWAEWGGRDDCEVTTGPAGADATRAGSP